MSTVVDSILKQYEQKVGSINPKAVGSNLLLMFAFSVGTLLAFNILRPMNKVVYQPKVKYYVGNKQPPKVRSSCAHSSTFALNAPIQIRDGFFDWIPPLIRTKEPEILEKVGLDAVAFLRFLRLLRWLFLAVSILACGALIPTNVLYHLKNNPSATVNYLSLLTIQGVTATLLAFTKVACFLAFTVLFFVWWHWKRMVVLRLQWFRSDEYLKSFYARTLMILHVPKKLQSDEGLQQLFDSMQIPYPTTAVHIGRRVGDLPDLVDYHNQAVRDLEQVLVTYLNGGRIAKRRPKLTIGGFCGIGGVQRDAIDYYTAKLKKTELAIEQWRTRIDRTKAENYGFASMAAVPYAHVVARILENKRPKGATVTLAPNPKDIIWKNLTKSDGTHMKNNILGFIYITLLSFVYIIPLLLVSLISNLASVSEYVSFLQTWSQKSQWSFSLVSGVLPPAISAFFYFLLPRTMRRLSKFQGAFVIFTLIGVGYRKKSHYSLPCACFQESIAQIYVAVGHHTSIGNIIKGFHGVPEQIQETYLSQSSYWLTFFPLRGFLVLFDLAQVVSLIWIFFKTRLFGRTPRDIREWTQPPDFQYAVFYSNLLFMAAVGLIYAPLAPLVALGACVVFWLSSFVYKYQLMYVFVSKVESGGRLWNVVMNRLLVSVVIMNLMMLLTIGLAFQWDHWLWIAMVPSVIIVIAFKIWMNQTFDSQFRYYIPNEAEIAKSKVHSEAMDRQGGRLSKRFGHPALHVELFTPMVHAKMMPLLPEVYKGRLAQEKTALNEYGGQKMEAAVTPDGVRIAAIEQSDIAWDLTMYQRNRAEGDWDTRSMASSTVFGGPSVGSPSIQHGKATSYFAGRSHDQYLNHGPMASQSEIELAQFGGTDQVPLLTADLYQGTPPQSFQQLPPEYSYPPPQRPFHQHRPSTGDSAWSGGEVRVPSMYGQAPAVPQGPASDSYRSAPLYRPNSGVGVPPNMGGPRPPPHHSQSFSNSHAQPHPPVPHHANSYSQSQSQPYPPPPSQQQHSRQGSGANFGGYR
ncbi:hypothetical protein BOTBODRAFT_41304 [Botryobasidium botryosum FD-172 SS1]|uniref:DUF221-domain-containing protein n=1 Tax=Botryobasidium botryosum (strain FD-172 SS1) TaxID=930990 RepID=A0A067MZB7_BOTB1|nr:hypothetical protein BOTBODRAFT_41304 [Botryobasidium botryosum FD-172 SS1]